MIQTRNQYLQFMLVMLAAWGIGGVDYISGQDQKWWPAAAGIAA